jgi:3',5'-cyclic AMP phosphodiesterase CpdA
VAVISDLNSTYGSKRYTSSVHAATEALVERVQPDLVLITGDMVAGQKSGLDYRGMWQAFHASVTDPLLEAGIPVAPTPGNHDAAPGFAKERRQYVAQWRDPKRAARVQYLDDSSYPLHYSFEQGGVFFAAVDATAVGPLRGRQHEWLDAQLAQTQADVKIVFGHLPIHPFAQHREREILADTELELILRRHDVAAYISGHHHAYYPGAVNGIRHVAAPCLGAGARALIGRSRRSPPALLVLDIDASGIAALEALQAPGFADVIERKTLPPRIDHRGHAVVRDDLAAN